MCPLAVLPSVFFSAFRHRRYRHSETSVISLPYSIFCILLHQICEFQPPLNYVVTPSVPFLHRRAIVSASSSSLVFLFPAQRTNLGISSMCAKPTSPQSQGMSCSNVSSPDSSFRHRNPKREQNFHEIFLLAVVVDDRFTGGCIIA